MPTIESDSQKIRRLESEVTMLNAILENIELAMDGHKVSDFALSFPLVRRAADMFEEKG